MVYNSLQRIFHDWFCHLATFLWPSDKANCENYVCNELLYVIQGVKIFSSWPHLISKFLVAPACLHAASDWPRIFLHPRCFC